MRKIFTLIATFAALGMLATSAFAYGVGDNIGKGDVQLYFDLNNAGLQDAAAGNNLNASEVTEYTWSCTKVVELGNGGENEIVQMKSQSTTDLAFATARHNRTGAVTGFTVVSASTSVDGPALGSCPDANSGFTFDDNLDDGDGAVLSFAWVAK